MSKNNHVQIPKLLMEPFSRKTEEGLKVYYLDFDDYEIHEEKINCLGAMPNYYNHQTETFLDKEVENKVGDVFKSVREISTNTLPDCFIIKANEEENIKRFFAYCLIRSRS